jgi:hypothetical protein
MFWSNFCTVVGKLTLGDCRFKVSWYLILRNKTKKIFIKSCFSQKITSIRFPRNVIWYWNALSLMIVVQRINLNLFWIFVGEE